jgi:hypothetical protein
MRKLARRLVAGVGVSAIAISLALGGLYWAARQVPDFYRQSLARHRDSEPASGERFEQQALALHNQLQHAGRWEVRFTENDVNGWLADDLPRKFPRLLPAGVSDPRVAIEENSLRLAIRYNRGSVDTVLSLAGEAYLTDQPNEVAIRIGQARAGFLPVPLARLLDDISERAARAGVPLRWTEARGAPVALVRVPFDVSLPGREKHDPQRLVLEQLHSLQGEFVVVGRIESVDSDAREQAAPTTAVQPLTSDTRQR